jgi:NTP pyrophosphatase (non-canonical NTP hydrolase)
LASAANDNELREHLQRSLVDDRPASLNAFCLEIHRDNDLWWRNPATGERIERNLDELLMLTVSEVAEAMEGERKSLMDTHLTHRPMAEVELADVVIRLADIAGSRELDIDSRFEIGDVDAWLDIPANRGAALMDIVRSLSGAYDHALDYVVATSLCLVFQYAEHYGYDLWGAVAEKREYNRHRADHKPSARLAANGKKF